MITEPFVGLRPFESAEAAIFFGRERETEILVNLIYSSGAVVVFAPSGMGKSSLLRAGVVPVLREESETIGPVLMLSDWRIDVGTQIRQSVAEQVGQVSTSKETTSLLSLLSNHRMRTRQRPVIILDQFEELLPERRDLAATWEELAPIINASPSPATLVLSIREDYLARLNDLMKRAPGLMSTSFRVEPPSVKALHDAVVGPLGMLQPQFKAEPALVSTVIDDLQRDDVGRLEVPLEPGYFQIVWSRLWEVDRESRECTITLQSYESEGGVDGIVAGFVDRTIDQVLSEDQKQLLYGVVRYIVLPTGAKMAMAVDDLAELLREDDMTDLARADSALLAKLGFRGQDQLGVKRRVIEELLTRLTRADAPVFRRIEYRQHIEFKLLHDVLGHILQEWRHRVRIASGLQLRVQLEQAQQQLTQQEANSQQQVRFRDGLWSEIQKARPGVTSPITGEREAAAEALGVVAIRASGVFPSVRHTAEEALNQLKQDRMSSVRKVAKRAVENLQEFDTMPTVPELPAPSETAYPFRFGLRGALGARRLLFFTQFYGLLSLCVISTFGADLITREVFPTARVLDYSVYRLLSLSLLVVLWTSIYAYDTLNNGVPWTAATWRRLVAPLLRPRRIGIGWFERLSVWPVNFLVPALIGNGFGALTGTFGRLPLGYLVAFWAANFVMWVSFGRAAV